MNPFSLAQERHALLHRHDAAGLAGGPIQQRMALNAELGARRLLVAAPGRAVGKGAVLIIVHRVEGAAICGEAQPVATRVISAVWTRICAGGQQSERQTETPWKSTSHESEFPSGRPYFVMELVRGIPITKFCEENHLTLKERIELFIPGCQAIQHAHQKGVIHRDIKPSNVLVTMANGVPHPMVIDFGVAKAISLKEVGYAEIQRIITREEPLRPSTALGRLNGKSRTIAANRKLEPAGLLRLIKGDLDWIVLKAIDKDRNRRYDTPLELAADLQRHLANEAVHAVAPSAGYRFKKFARRHQASVVIGIAVLLGAFVSSWQAIRATRAQGAAEQQAATAEAALRFVQQVLLRGQV